MLRSPAALRAALWAGIALQAGRADKNRKTVFQGIEDNEEE